MKLREFFSDDDAVSPVIGIILMVAITVILAAVIATFVLGLGDDVSDTSPTGSFSFDYNDGASFDGTYSTGENCYTGSAFPLNETKSSVPSQGILDITYDSGDEVEAGQLTLTDGDTSVPLTDCRFAASSEISAGTTVSTPVDSNDVIRVVWEDEQGSSSSTIGKWNGPDS